MFSLVHLRIVNDCLLHVTVCLPSIHLPQNIVADYLNEKSVAFVLGWTPSLHGIEHVGLVGAG